MRNKNLQIFVLSFGREKVPTLKEIKHPESVIVLTSTDNKFKDKIEAHGAQVVVFDKESFKGRGLEMLNEESVSQKRSAVYGYNYAIEWGRKNGVRYILVLDDDYIATEYINDRNRGTFPYIDVWARHAVEFLKKHPQIGATCAINNGQLMSNSRSAYFTNLRKRQLMNTIIFDTTKEQHFESLGNGDYVTQAIMNTGSRDMIVRLQTISLRMETIKQKKHETIDYAGMFYKRWALKMAAPAYADVRILKGGQKGNIMTTRFNSVWHGNSAPKIINLE